MKFPLRITIPIVIILFTFTAFSFIPLTRYVVNSNVEFVVSGTSSLHDWEMETNKAVGDADITVQENLNTIKKVHQLDIKVPVKTLKSGKSGMDENAYEALESEDHPHIEFSLQEVVTLSQLNDMTVIQSKGDLTIAGNTRTISLKVLGKMNDEKIHFSGNKSLKMTDYGVKPPKALMGTVKTGDQITINFHVAFAPNDSNIN